MFLTLIYFHKIYRQVENLLESGQLDPNTWLRYEGEDGDEEEATGLMIIARLPASSAEKREVNGPLSFRNDRRGSTNSSNSDSSSGGLPSTTFVSKGVSKDRIRMALLFVSHGADVNVKDARGKTALMYASMNGLIELVLFLLNQGADYMMQEIQGNNSLMFSLQYPTLVKLFLDFMEENGRPDSFFWRQRTIDGKSIFDLAKENAMNNSLAGSHKSLQLLTQFITNYSHYTAYKAPAPLPEQLIQMQSPRRKSHHSTRSTGSHSPSGTSNRGLSPVCRHTNQLLPPLDADSFDDRDTMSHLDSNMKRSRSLREFWEKETIDWFTSVHSTGGQDDLSEIPSVINPQTRRSSQQQASLMIPFDGESSTDTGVTSGEGLIKLPPIPSPLIRHEEWRERGHSLNRRTSVNILRTVNPIH